MAIIKKFFHPGQKLICVNNTLAEQLLTKGKDYIAREILNETILLTADNGQPIYAQFDRFDEFMVPVKRVKHLTLYVHESDSEGRNVGHPGVFSVFDIFKK